MKPTDQIGACVLDRGPVSAEGGFQATWQFVLVGLVAIFAVNLLLRAFYLRYQFVNGDEAVRALTALGVLGGDRLYADIITDKPPGATLFYAAVLFFFKHNMPAVHIAAILWNFGTAMAVYFLGTRFYSKKTGLWAALLFVYFSASYLTQDAMAANTELLMTLPYVLSCYCYLRGCAPSVSGPGLVSSSGVRSTGRTSVAIRGPGKYWLWLVAAGLLAGIAAMFKQVGVLLLFFFALNETFNWILDRRNIILFRRRPDGAGKNCPKEHREGIEDGSESPGVITALRRLGFVAVGLGLVALTLLAWLLSSNAIFGFWRNAIQLGAFYVGSLPARMWLWFFFSRSFGYVLLTACLWVLAGLGLGPTLRLAGLSIGRKTPETPRAIGIPGLAGSEVTDVSIVLWCLVSLAGVFSSGRFYGHYFIPALPGLALLGARGIARLSTEMLMSRRRLWSRSYAAVVIFLFLFNLVRFHHRTAILAYETVTGRRTAWSQAWGFTRREQEAEQIANTIRSRGLDEGQPLYIWGYALDLYWRSGCKPASRYLTPYYVTGGFYPEVSSSNDISGGNFWQEARSQLIDDLRRSRPQLILNVDEQITSLPYPEIVDFVVRNYRFDGLIGPDPAHQFIVYAIKE